MTLFGGLESTHDGLSSAGGNGGVLDDNDEVVTYTFEGGRPVVNVPVTPTYPREATRRVNQALIPPSRSFNADERKLELERETAKRTAARY